MQFKVTSNAIRRINALRHNENNPKLALRVSVLGGGCSGFQYKYEITSQHSTEDEIITINNTNVFIDKEAMAFLSGCTLDYVEELGRAGFEIQNPNATAKCGCGNSFAM